MALAAERSGGRDGGMVPSEWPTEDEARRAHRLFYRGSDAVMASALSPAATLPESEVPRALARLSRLLRMSDAPNATLGVAACDFVGLDRADPLRRAVEALGRKADDMGRSNPYHNKDHMRDVLLATLAIATADERRAGALTPHQKGLLLVAALGHDLGHDGVGNTIAVTGEDGVVQKISVPFRLETLAADETAAALAAAGASAQDVRAARGIILGTDVAAGYPILRGGDAGSVPPDLAALASDRQTLRLARILRDADLLGSSGLSPSMSDEQTARLESELRLPPGGLGAKGTEYFLRQMVGGAFMSEGAQAMFGPVLTRLLEANALRLAEPALATASLVEAAARLPRPRPDAVSTR